MANGVSPIRVGLLYDFPQGDGTFEAALQLGIDEVAATGRLDRPFEFVARDGAWSAGGERARGRRAASTTWSRKASP